MVLINKFLYLVAFVAAPPIERVTELSHFYIPSHYHDNYEGLIIMREVKHSIANASADASAASGFFL